ncbi:MAG: hypothetical protein WD826_07245, partial [Actinomycetota bacterium]
PREGVIYVSALVRDTSQVELPRLLRSRACLGLALSSPVDFSGAKGYGCRAIPMGGSAKLWTSFERSRWPAGDYVAFVYIVGTGSGVVEQIRYAAP